MLLAAACSSDDDAPPPRVRLTVLLVEEPLLVGDAGDRPIPLAEIAFDPPSGQGERITTVSGDDGRASFDVAEEMLAGGAAVTVYSRDHLSYSRLDVTEREVTLFVPRLDAAVTDRTVELTGTFSGKSPLGGFVDLSTSRLDRLGRATTLTPTYSLRAPRAQPFFIVGHEQLESGTMVKSFRIDVDAKDADARLDVDLASVTELPRRVVHVRVTPPSSMGADAEVTANVVGAESSLFLGTPVKVENGDVELSVADTDLAGERALTRAVVIARDGSRSIRTELGVPSVDRTFGDLPSPPTVPEASRLMTEPIPLSDFPGGADLRVEMIAGGKLGWVLVGPRGGLGKDSIALPPMFRVVFPRLVAVTIAAESDPVELGSHRRFYRRVAVSRDVLLHR